MTTFIISCEGDRETGISGEIAMLRMDTERFSRKQTKKLKEGLAEVFRLFWNSGPVKVEEIEKSPDRRDAEFANHDG